MISGIDMKHDPFCRAYYPDLLEVEKCTWCNVIRRVREHEKESIDLEYWRGYNIGYIDGFPEAEEMYANKGGTQ
jgi:hypothetical protein